MSAFTTSSKKAKRKKAKQPRAFKKREAPSMVSFNMHGGIRICPFSQLLVMFFWGHFMPASVSTLPRIIGGIAPCTSMH